MTGPNVVLFITDQQTRATISAYGNDRTHTPHMDELAAGGVAFENSYCSSPLCSPGRASIVTGHMPHTAGVDVNDLPVRDGIANLGEIFSSAGYETVWAGKWNLPESFPPEPDDIGGFGNLAWQRRPYPSVQQIIAGDFSPVDGQEPYRDLGTSMDADITDAAVRYLAGAPAGALPAGRVALQPPRHLLLDHRPRPRHAARGAAGRFAARSAGQFRRGCERARVRAVDARAGGGDPRFRLE